MNGMQTNDENIEITTSAEYYCKNGKHYIKYDEIAEETGGVTKSVIKIGPETVEVIKKGENNVHMLFEEGKQATSVYSLPFMSLNLTIDTTRIEFDIQEDSFSLNIYYGLDINYNHMGDTVMRITGREKNL